MTRTYTAWVVYGRTKSEGAFPLWKRIGDTLPHFTTKAALRRFIKSKRIRLGGAMRLSIVRCTVTCFPALKGRP